MKQSIERRYPIGAEVRGGGVDFRVHATAARRVEVDVDGQRHSLERSAPDAFELFVPGVQPGARYAYRLDGGEPLPDPASHFQPDGPHGASCVVDHAFAWTDDAWPGTASGRQVIYELHIGTFTPGRTWRAATAQLDVIAQLGVTALEVMPVAEFPGRFGWGYDGVQLFAPYHGYGTPHDMRAFIDRAHALGMAVLLDVVYNHLGPDGNYLPRFMPSFFSQRHVTDWGAGLNFDDAGCEVVREYVTCNASYWIREFHIDGLRLDATQNVVDETRPHILRDIADSARAAAGGRRVMIIAENETQDATLLRATDAGGYDLDALWNDDFHHSARVALTGHDEAYYSDYRGSAQELVSLATRGWLYQGQRYAWQHQRRGTAALDIGPRRLVVYLQNHDQIANALHGERLHALTDAGSLRALTALLLLGSSHVLLFQGQEYAASQPFLYFADHAGELGDQVTRGRYAFLRQFASIASIDAPADVLDDPRSLRTLERSTLDPTERHSRGHAHWLALHRDLIGLARRDAVLRTTKPAGAVLGSRALALRWHASGGDRLLLVNLGRRIRRGSIAEPLLAPPACAHWTLCWSSNDVRYGGGGTPGVETVRGWQVPAHAAVLLEPAPEKRGSSDKARRSKESDG
ncbi:MAG: malto-oligosyltrehalose trehalohydrolase [Longimicrobiales bacterium]